nr:NUDIX domain-containing protein [Seinonella peptonophila]
MVPAASAIVVNQEGAILLHKRLDNQLWSLLGGAMELGESIEETIIREVKEESGLDVQMTRCIGIYTDPNHIIAYTDGEVRQQFSICFACMIIRGELTVSSESIQLRFFTQEELDEIDMHPAQRKRIKDYFAQAEKTFIR